MKKTIISFFLLLFFFSSFAQNSAPIKVNGSFWKGVTFESNGDIYKFRNVLPLVQSNQEAYKLMKSAKSNYDIGMVLGMAGGFMVGWPLGTSLGGGDPNWTLAAVGAGLIVISIPLTSGAMKKAKESANKFNDGLNTISQKRFKPQLEFASMKTGIGFRLTF